uniref:RxLR effector candidate protein n=1 Tax=Hyaloperonospora arabidopsidis (strain Emoy2) TaxID=559515 RepID=M4BUV4_HYAAE
MTRIRLMLAAFSLAPYCCSFGRAYDIVPITKLESNQKIEATDDGSVNFFLKDSKEIKAELEDEARAFTTGDTSNFKILFEKIPYAEQLKYFVSGKPQPDKVKGTTDTAKDATDAAKAATAEIPKEYTKLEAWKIILKGMIKPLVIIAAMALAGGMPKYGDCYLMWSDVLHVSYVIVDLMPKQAAGIKHGGSLRFTFRLKRSFHHHLSAYCEWKFCLPRAYQLGVLRGALHKY